MCKSTWVFGVLGLVLSGCASLSNQVFQNVHEGDSAEKVRNLLGSPHSFKASNQAAGAQIWTYTKEADTCLITMQESLVRAVSCEKDPNHVGPGGRFAKGFSSGWNSTMKNLQDKNMTCNTSSDGYGNATTNCH